MPGPYFHKAGWPPFVHRGTTYDLAHLSEYEFTVEDTDKQTRTVAVTFTDHCFTREEEPGDDPALFYPGSSRQPGVFCFIRYALALKIRDHIARAAGGSVWNLEGESFAAVPLVDSSGQSVLYGVIFSLDAVTGLPVQLHMRVRTAYPVDEKELVTYGAVRFKHLVALRMKGKRPSRLMDRNRRRPHNPALPHKKK